MRYRIVFIGLFMVFLVVVSGQENGGPAHPLPRQNVTSETEMDAPPVIFYTGAGKRTIHVASREGPWPAGG